MLKQKARVQWYEEGDENSKYFHAKVRKRYRKNGFRGLMVDGIWCENASTIKQTVYEYFKGVYSETDTRRPKFISNRFKRLTEMEANLLEAEFEEKEVWEAVKSCGSSKAPGPDGFNFKFLKKCWEIIKPDIMRAVRWFWENERISRGCNSSFIALIPKIVDPISLGDFRPISLIGCYYKIVAKILAERLKKVIDKLIGEVQSAFIKDRFILDGVLLVNEVVDFIKKSKNSCLIFKVDFEKAYDCVNRKFLYEVMHQMGFGRKWCGWIQACLETATSSILVNGAPTNEFVLQRGIRQGDPLSPFLFLLVAEGLNVMMQEVLNSGLYEGIKVGSDDVCLTHLQYADDTIFIGKWNRNNIVNLMKLLKCFQLASGLKVNLNKSKMYGIGIEMEEIEDYARSLECRAGKLPFFYLGLPVGNSMGRIENWNLMVDKFKSKLAD